MVLTQRTQSFIARFAECFSCLFGLENRMGYEVNQNMSPLCYLVSCCFKMVFNAKGARLYRKVRRVIFSAFLNRKGREGIGLIRAYGHFVTWFSAASKWFLTQRAQSFIARFAERFFLLFWIRKSHGV
jgi:hypothetical protein